MILDRFVSVETAHTVLNFVLSALEALELDLVLYKLLSDNRCCRSLVAVHCTLPNTHTEMCALRLQRLSGANCNMQK